MFESYFFQFYRKKSIKKQSATNCKTYGATNNTSHKHIRTHNGTTVQQQQQNKQKLGNTSNIHTKRQGDRIIILCSLHKMIFLLKLRVVYDPPQHIVSALRSLVYLVFRNRQRLTVYIQPHHIQYFTYNIDSNRYLQTLAQRLILPADGWIDDTDSS